MTHRIEPGQEYISCLCDPSDDHAYRIRVLAKPVSGVFGEGKVRVGTVTEDGRVLRLRYIAVRQLHDNPARRTGYRLVRHADGTPAGGAQ